MGVSSQGIYEIIVESLNDLLAIHGELNAFVSKGHVSLKEQNIKKSVASTH